MDYEKIFECGGALEIGGPTAQQQTPMETLNAAAAELSVQGNRPEGGQSTLFRTHPLWERGL